MTNEQQAQQQAQFNAQNKKLAQMNDAEFAAAFDELTTEQAKKALQQLQQKTQNGNNNQA